MVHNLFLKQDMMEGVGGTDASGNPILGDIGKFFFDKVCSDSMMRLQIVDLMKRFNCSLLQALNTKCKMTYKNVSVCIQ